MVNKVSQVMALYWDKLEKEEQEALASKTTRSVDYLRQVFKYGRKASANLALDIERHTGGYITRQIVRPDIYPPEPKRTTNNDTQPEV